MIFEVSVNDKENWEIDEFTFEESALIPTTEMSSDFILFVNRNSKLSVLKAFRLSNLECS